MKNIKSLAYASTFPKYMYIAPTNICNYKCGVCARKDVMRKKRGFMDVKLFKKIVDDIPDTVKTIYLHKQGESLLHPKLPEMMKYLKTNKPEIKLKLNTNGKKLNPKIIDELIKYIDNLTVSIWSIKPSTYSKLHGVNGFDRIIENVQQIISAKDKSGSSMELWIDYVNQEGNKDETDDDVMSFFKEHFSDVTISFWWTVNFMGLGKEGNLQIYDKLEYDKFPICIFPWTNLNVTWDGYVDYCFFDAQEIYFMGDLNNQKISDVWNNEKYLSFRENFLLKKFDAFEKDNVLCRKCSFLWSLQTQRLEELSSKSLQKYFSENLLRNKETWEDYLNQEGKNLNDFYGYRKKI